MMRAVGKLMGPQVDGAGMGSPHDIDVETNGSLNRLACRCGGSVYCGDDFVMVLAAIHWEDAGFTLPRVQ